MIYAGCANSRKLSPRKHGVSWQPDLDRLVDTPRGYDVHELLSFLLGVARTVGRRRGLSALRRGLTSPRQTGHKVPMGLYRLHAPTSRELPHAYCIIIRRGQEELPSGMENKGAHPIIMASLNMAGIASCDVSRSIEHGLPNF